MKILYKAFEYYSQQWIFVKAYSLEQSLQLFRMRVLKINGKYRYNEGIIEYNDNGNILHPIKF